jgi:hypothetical protein
VVSARAMATLRPAETPPGSCGASVANLRSSTGSSTPFALVGAGLWSSAVSRAWARRPCWTWSGCRGLFCLIGAEPATEWLSGVAVDEDGFIRTDRDLTSQDLSATWSLLGRARLPYETSVPAVFAAGDVRSGSMKRVASAVGEGASTIRSVHLALAPGA